jgi:hypothetical protein
MEYCDKWKFSNQEAGPALENTGPVSPCAVVQQNYGEGTVISTLDLKR